MRGASSSRHPPARAVTLCPPQPRNLLCLLARAHLPRTAASDPSPKGHARQGANADTASSALSHTTRQLNPAPAPPIAAQAAGRAVRAAKAWVWLAARASLSEPLRKGPRSLWQVSRPLLFRTFRMACLQLERIATRLRAAVVTRLPIRPRQGRRLRRVVHAAS